MTASSPSTASGTRPTSRKPIRSYSRLCRIAGEHQVELHGVEAERPGLDERVVDERFADPPAPEGGDDEVAGVDDVGAATGEVGLEEVRAGQATLQAGDRHQGLVVEPVVLEVVERERAGRLGVALAGVDDLAERLEQLGGVVGPGLVHRQLQAAHGAQAGGLHPANCTNRPPGGAGGL